MFYETETRIRKKGRTHMNSFHTNTPPLKKNHTNKHLIKEHIIMKLVLKKSVDPTAGQSIGCTHDDSCPVIWFSNYMTLTSEVDLY